MEEEKVRFSFWKKVDSNNSVVSSGEIIDAESVLVGNRFFITGKTISGQILDLQEFQLGNLKLDSSTWETRSVQGQHPSTDNVSLLYLLSVPENSDYRYQVIEYALETNTSTVLDTTGIAPKQRKAPLSCVFYSSALYFFGGLQIYRGDATGSFVYKLDLESKEWNNIDYSGVFPATVPHAPITGCRSGHSTARIGNSVFIFGGTMVEDSLLNPECLTSSVFDSLYDYKQQYKRSSRIRPDPRQVDQNQLQDRGLCNSANVLACNGCFIPVHVRVLRRKNLQVRFPSTDLAQTQKKSQIA